MNLEELKRSRSASWLQDDSQRIANAEEAKPFIERLKVVSHYNASTEVPNLYDAHMGRANAPTDSKHDSPAGYVYSWRWDLGKAEAAFYGAIVARRPTWVAWDVLPFVLGAFMEMRHPEELHELGLLSSNALRISSALEEAKDPMRTDELRQAAGFPAGKPQRAAYLKALEELETRLIVAKPFLPDGEMAHVLVDLKYHKAVEEARNMRPDEALAKLLARLLPEWIYMESKPLSRALRIPEDRLVAALCQLGARETVDGKARYFSR